MLAFGQTPHVGWPLGLQPSAIIILQCAMCSLAWRWRLQSALRADQESFSIESDPLLLDSKAPCQQLRVVLQLQGRTNWSISVYLWEKLCPNIIVKLSDSDPNTIEKLSALDPIWPQIHGKVGWVIYVKDQLLRHFSILNQIRFMLICNVSEKFTFSCIWGLVS